MMALSIDRPASDCRAPPARGRPSHVVSLVLGVALAVAAVPCALASSAAVGAYDPHGDFRRSDDLAIEHVYLPWTDIDLDSLSAVDRYAGARGRTILATVEPWSWAPSRAPRSEDLLAGIRNGAYDDTARAVCSALGALDSAVVVRWGHEMDHRTGRYPWAQWSPEEYVDAYRWFVATCSEASDDLRFMWSPLGRSTHWSNGTRSVSEFYPGDDVVDVIGATVLAVQDYDLRVSGRPLGFVEHFAPVYDMLKQHGKPIWIAELGFTGDPDFEQTWAAEVAQAQRAFPELDAVVYFNACDVVEWPADVGVPCWRKAP